MSEDTKQRIIEAGAELVHQRGFNNTGLKDILQAAGVPKGSFYFYFDNKEAFGIEMVDYYGKKFNSLIHRVRKDETLSPLEQIRSIFKAFHNHFETQGYTRGCPVGNLAQEMGDLSELFRAKLMAAMDGMCATIAEMLDEAKASGEIPNNLDSRETSIFMIEAWHGAIVRMKVTKSPEPLDLFGKFIFEKVLK